RQPRGLPVLITRRNAIFLGTAALACGGFGAAFLWNGIDAKLATAAAAAISKADLMQAGPLGDRAMGAADAPVTIIEYASMTCPHCARLDTEVLPQLKEKYMIPARSDSFSGSSRSIDWRQQRSCSRAAPRRTNIFH